VERVAREGRAGRGLVRGVFDGDKGSFREDRSSWKMFSTA
jgi:hypothetical protein